VPQDMSGIDDLTGGLTDIFAVKPRVGDVAGLIDAENVFAVAEKGAADLNVFQRIVVRGYVVGGEGKGRSVVVILVAVEDVFKDHVADIRAMGLGVASGLGGDDVIGVVFGVDVAEIGV